MKALSYVFSTLFALTAFRAGAESETVEIHVKDPSGKPAAGATIDWYAVKDIFGRFGPAPELLRRTMAGPDGISTLTLTNRSSLVVLVKQPGLSFWSVYRDASAADRVMEVQLTKPSFVSGKVLDAQGQPVADAEVWPASMMLRRPAPGQPFDVLLPKLGRQASSAKTGPDGSFRLEGLPDQATLAIEAVKPGLASKSPPAAFLSETLPLRAGQMDVVVTLVPAATIEGVVTREDNGQPLADVRVGQDFGSSSPAVTAPDGRFQLAGLSPGTITLDVSHGTNTFADWVFERTLVTLESGKTNRDVKLTGSKGGVLKLGAFDPSGAPVPNLQIYVSQQGNAAPALTGPDGVAWLRLPPGDYYSSCGADPRWKQAYSQTPVTAGETNEVRFDLVAATVVSGLVQDPDGRSTNGISVQVVPYGQQTTTDAEGKFKVTLQDTFNSDSSPGLLARDPKRNLACMLKLEEGTTNCVLKLTPGIILAGRIADPSGKPLTNASVQSTLRFGNFGMPAEEITADAEGRFEIRGLPPMENYTVQAGAPGYGRTSHSFEPKEDQTRYEADVITLQLANLRLTGTVLDSDDKPRSGVSIHLSGEGQPNTGASTDAEGKFVFEAVCAGPVNLFARMPSGGGFGSTTAEGGDTNVVIRLGVNARAARPGGTRFTGIVVKPDGSPAPAVEVLGFPNQAGGLEKTGPDGKFKLHLQSFGSRNPGFVILARDTGGNLAAAVPVEEGETNITVKLEPGIIVTGKVADEAGRGLASAEIQIYVWTRSMGNTLGQSIKANPDGTFEIPALPAGQLFGFDASAKGYGRESRRLELENQNGKFELEPYALAVADRPLAGVVVDDDDKPVARAYVHIYGEKQPQLGTQTDAKGRFSFKAVCSGTVRLSVSGNQAYANATAEGGDTNITVALSRRSYGAEESPAISLKGKPLPDLAKTGVELSGSSQSGPVLVLILDAQQRPSRRAAKALCEQADLLKSKGVSVLLLNTGEMPETELEQWRQDMNLPYPVGSLKAEGEKARVAWGVTSLPWLILTGKDRKVRLEGFPVEELEANLKD